MYIYIIYFLSPSHSLSKCLSKFRVCALNAKHNHCKPILM